MLRGSSKENFNLARVEVAKIPKEFLAPTGFFKKSIKTPISYENILLR